METLSNLIQQIATSYWAWCASVASGVYGLFLWLERQTSGEGALNAGLRNNLVLLLMGVYKVEAGEYSRRFNAMFDRVFAIASPGRLLLRSALASMLAVVAIAYLLGPVLGLTNTRGASDLSLLQFLALGMIINILPDFLSLLETRLLLNWLGQLRHPLLHLGILILDLILSAAIILIGIHLFHLLRGTDPPSLIETVALFSPYSIFFYSTFLTSAWAWLYFASAWTIRMTSGPLSHVLNIEKKPFLSLGTLAAAITFLGLTLAGAGLRPTEAAEGGIASRLDIFLCRHFPEDACDHMARLSKDDEDLIRRLEAICEGRSLEYCIDHAQGQFGVNDSHARRLWFRACNAGNAMGCANLGYFYSNGLGGERDEAMARDLHQQGCDGGNASGCVRLGYSYQFGIGGEQDEAKARDLYRQGCDGGDADACHNLGVLYREGIGGKQDEAMARKLHQQGCDDGHAKGCTGLGYLYQKGLGGEQSETVARKFYRQGCDDGDAVGCYNLGVLYREGIGGTRDEAGAREFYELSCDLDYPKGCTSLGILYGESIGGERDEVKARAFFQRGCDGGDAVGCYNLGVSYEFARGGERDIAIARKSYQQGCDGSDADGCTNLGYFYENGIGGERDGVAAREFYRQGCDGGNARGCSRLGFLHQDGIGGERDEVMARNLYRQGCGGGHAWGCGNLAELYEQGIGGDADSDEAAEYRARACALDDKFCE